MQLGAGAPRSGRSQQQPADRRPPLTTVPPSRRLQSKEWAGVPSLPATARRDKKGRKRHASNTRPGAELLERKAKAGLTTPRIISLPMVRGGDFLGAPRLKRASQLRSSAEEK